MTTTTEMLRLLAWLSPAFPTGGFAWSHGIEWAEQAGDIRDPTSLRVWTEDVLLHGSGRTDAILLRQAHASISVAALALAVQPSRERWAETVGQGNAFRAAARAWCATLLPDTTDLPYPVAVGALACWAGLDVELTCAGYLQAFASNLISAAVRLVPLGQTQGLAVLAALEPTILAVTRSTRHATLDDIGGACWRSDLAAMRHETQYTRLFRS